MILLYKNLITLDGKIDAHLDTDMFLPILILDYSIERDRIKQILLYLHISSQYSGVNLKIKIDYNIDINIIGKKSSIIAKSVKR